MTALVIVESPAKARTIQSYLGDGYVVTGSAGHIRDLPQKEMGVDLDTFEPNYVTIQGKSPIISKLKTAAANADEVYIASDLDREGEAIGWHLVEVLKLRNYKRIAFDEVSKKAILNAIANPRQLDMNLVRAQEGRRVLDRIIGYWMSPALARALSGRFTSGRVQSPVTRLVYDRHMERKNFVSSDYLTVHIEVVKDNMMVKAKLKDKDFRNDHGYFMDHSIAEAARSVKQVAVVEYEKYNKTVSVPEPFITSTLLQEASSNLKISTQKTQHILQSLYDNGYLTYIRTDSPGLSEDALVQIRAECEKNGYAIPEKPNQFHAKDDNAQEAHECIRPKNIAVADTGSDDKAVQGLYDLIRRRTLACQMEAGTNVYTKVKFKAVVEGYEYEASSTVENKLGWREVYRDTDEDPQAPEDNAKQLPDLLPEYSSQEPMSVTKGSIDKKKTTAPPLFTEKALLKLMEKKGIGRPATYANTLSTILDRGYVEVNKQRKWDISIRGISKVVALVGKFDYMEYDYTSELEKDLDLIATGEKSYFCVLKDAVARLDKQLGEFSKGTYENLENANAPDCPADGCNGKMVLKGKGKKQFLGCTNYRDGCEEKLDKNGKPFEKREIYDLEDGQVCPKCNEGTISTIKYKKAKDKEFFCCSVKNCKLFQAVDQE